MLPTLSTLYTEFWNDFSLKVLESLKFYSTFNLNVHAEKSPYYVYSVF